MFLFFYLLFFAFIFECNAICPNPTNSRMMQLQKNQIQQMAGNWFLIWDQECTVNPNSYKRTPKDINDFEICYEEYWKVENSSYINITVQVSQNNFQQNHRESITIDPIYLNKQQLNEKYDGYLIFYDMNGYLFYHICYLTIYDEEYNRFLFYSRIPGKTAPLIKSIVDQYIDELSLKCIYEYETHYKGINCQGVHSKSAIHFTQSTLPFLPNIAKNLPSPNNRKLFIASSVGSSSGSVVGSVFGAVASNFFRNRNISQKLINVIKSIQRRI